LEAKELLIKASNELGINLNETQINQFLLYKKLLLEWNEKINLTAITDENEIILKHFVDCLSIGAVYNIAPNTRIIDVGTGAGFPGVPIKIAYPEVNITLLDSLNKRITFLEELSSQLGLENINLVHSRAEDGGQNKLYREKYDLCASRAVANLAVLAEYCLPFVAIGGHFVALKGPDVEQELNESKVAIKKLGGEILDVKKVNIPYSDIHHSIVIIRKIRQTPCQYPRKAGKVSKEPIK
jgi:16S rRNA (guanine527-N7)-methyltransferase